MNEKLIEQITRMINNLNDLNIKGNSEDRHKISSIILYSQAMRQLLQEEETINMNKFHSMLSEHTQQADTLIAKWNT